MIIGLTGMTGAGKSAAAEILRRQGCEIIDADKISHEVTAAPEIISKIKNAFGEGAINADGTLNRRALGREVFADAEKLRRLNAIVHPAVTERIRLDAAKAEESGKIAVVDAALLFECGLDAICDRILCITADRELRLKRIAERDGLSREEALNRINSQSPCGSGFTEIDNSSDLAELERKVKETLWQENTQK